MLVKEVLGPRFESASGHGEATSTLLGYILCLVNILSATAAGVYCEMLIKTSGTPDRAKEKDTPRATDSRENVELTPHARTGMGGSSISPSMTEEEKA